MLLKETVVPARCVGYAPSGPGTAAVAPCGPIPSHRIDASSPGEGYGYERQSVAWSTTQAGNMLAGDKLCTKVTSARTSLPRVASQNKSAPRLH
jgi:hypothetical protein